MFLSGFLQDFFFMFDFLWFKNDVHLHNGIVCRKKEEGIPTVCESLVGTGEYYATWNKSVGETQIPYDLTYKRNITNKNKRMSKTEPKAWKHGTDWQQPEGRGSDNGGKKRGRD